MDIDSTQTMPPLRTNFVDPVDVLGFLHAQIKAGKNCALIVVTNTHGGGVRAPGALAGVGEDQSCAGYISNGCVDADMFAQARGAIADGVVRQLRYGAGSPYRDIVLPCGGAVDLMVVPNPSLERIERLCEALAQRRAIGFSVSVKHGLTIHKDSPEITGWSGDEFHVRCAPKLRLRIAGRGTEAVALIRAAHALDFDVYLQSPDESPLHAARALGFEALRLKSADEAPPCDDDAHTAFVMMFHDHDWESALLIKALKGDAFYIGALGGRKTHASRCAALKEAGLSQSDIDRVIGPIGLVPSVRNASYLAVSVLAQIIDRYGQN